MHIGICKFRIRLPQSRNIKDKRKVIRSITSGVHSRFNVAIAEVGDYDLWQSSVLGVGCVSNDSRHANEIISRVFHHVESHEGDFEILDHQIEIIHGV